MKLYGVRRRGGGGMEAHEIGGMGWVAARGVGGKEGLEEGGLARGCAL